MAFHLLIRNYELKFMNGLLYKRFICAGKTDTTGHYFLNELRLELIEWFSVSETKLK